MNVCPMPPSCKPAASAPGYAQALVESTALMAIRGMTPSITLADPKIYDTPLIGVSTGFEQITGYAEAECTGQNCRFLNGGVAIPREERLQLRRSVSLGTRFLGVLDNRRKDGTLFKNLLHMSTVRIFDQAYIVGIQGNVTHTDLDIDDCAHLAELQLVVDRIFAANLDSWVGMAAAEFRLSLPVPYSRVLMESEEKQYRDAAAQFVQQERDIKSAMTHCVSVYHKNTFLHFPDHDNQDKPLCRSMSDSDLQEVNVLVGTPKKGSRWNICVGGPNWSDSPSPCPTDCPHSDHDDSCGGDARTISNSSSAMDSQARDNTASQLVMSSPPSPMSSPPSPMDTPLHTDTCPSKVVQSQQNANSGQYDTFSGMRTSDGTLSSVGSAGHPDKCKECQFFFFSQSGCKNGQNCGFCHAFHPRVKDKKNRRLQKRIEAMGKSDSQISEAAKPEKPELKPNNQPAGMPNLKPSTLAQKFRLTYPSQQCEASGKVTLIFAAGQPVHAPCQVEGMAAAQSSLNFVVSPALPAGLTLDAQTGMIEGTARPPADGKLEALTEHTVKVSVVVVAEGLNIPLGSIVLCEAQLAVRIVNLMALQSQVQWITACSDSGTLNVQFTGMKCQM